MLTHSVIGVQVHDARIAALMRSHAVAHVLTLNAADFHRYGVHAVTPAEVTAARPPAGP